MADLFFYGTLCHAPLLRLVLGGDSQATTRPGRLNGYRVAWAEGQSFPMIHAAPGASAKGVLVEGLTQDDLARLDFYEGGFGYRLIPVDISTQNGPAAAEVYLPDDGLWTPGTDWSLEDWVRGWGAMTLRAAEEVMGYFGAATPEEIAARFPTIRMRADSWVRAQSEDRPRELRSELFAEDVESVETRRPYAKFFMLEEQEVCFRRHDGRQSAAVTRAAFVSADAVTVLPYDPVRDRVMVIEQFRFAPYVRGDRHPWTLEPIAGRIDPGETVEDTARREALEETGLTLGRLEPVANYYVSPGAVTEYLYSFVAICDLPDDAAGTGGLDGEEEDIRAIVLSYDDLMDTLASGEAKNGPLILSALWLARNRDRLRPAA